MAVNDPIPVALVEGGASRQYLVEHCAQGVEVASAVHVVSPCLFRGHVRGGAQVGARDPQRLVLFGVGDAKVGQLDRAFGLGHQQHVGRFDVPVNDILPVDIGQGVTDLREQRIGLAKSKLLMLL